MHDDTSEELPLTFEGFEESPYAGFWRRFGAFWLDFLIMLPWTVAISFFNHAGRLNTLYSFIPSYLFFFFYSIYTVKRWGGTPGKLLTGVIIVRKDGKKAGWKEAGLRYAVQLVLGIPMNVAFVMVMLGMTDEQYMEMGFLKRSEYIVNNMPVWYSWTNWANQIWIWSEFLVLLLNKRKRAIHDYIAGTVVIKGTFKSIAEQYSSRSLPPPDPVT